MGRGQSKMLNANYIIPEEYKEFRVKFVKNWMSLPFYKYTQQDIDRINNLYKKQVDEIGQEKFNEKDFLQMLPKLDKDKFSLSIFQHLYTILSENLPNGLQGEYPDVKQFFMIYVIYLLCNPKLDQNKMVLANMVDFYLKRPKKDKKKKKGEKDDAVDDKKEEPKGPQKKKINITQFGEVIRYLYSFTRTVLSYFIMIYIFMFDSMKHNPFLFQTDKLKEVDGQKMWELEFTFYTNFLQINHYYDSQKQENMWIEYILQPLSVSKHCFNN